jgi:malate permease and related proteins
MGDWMLIVEKLLIFFLLMMTGWLLVKVGMLDEHASRKISAIVVNVANPALIISSAFNTDAVLQSKLLLTAGIAVALFAVMLGVAAFIPRLLRVQGQAADAYSLMTVFSNIGFMGLPLLSALYGSAALLYGSVFLIPYNLLIYTYGEGLMRRSGKAGGSRKFSLRKVLNPGVIASIVAVILYLTGTTLPDVIAAPIGYLSNLTAPLSMMVIGASLVGVKVKEFYTDKRMLLFAVLKLIVFPAAACLLLRLVLDDAMLLGVCAVMLAAPVGSMTAMIAQEFGGAYKLVSRGVALTTILCVATIPLVFAIAGI